MSRRTDQGPLGDMRHFARKAIGMFGAASADDLESDTAVDTVALYLPKLVGQLYAILGGDSGN